MSEKPYDKRYYDAVTPGSSSSAEEVVPVLLELICPGSVVDIGCGAGAWLLAWEKNGVTDYYGIDGSYVQPEQLLFDKTKFTAADLEKGFSLPRKFDLVMSLEVAEHIDPASAPVFIGSLCKLGDLVLFSAAIPGQGGVHHVNEQYPGYWAAIFKQYGYSVYDCIRERIWSNKKIDTCYRQNLLFFVKDTVKEIYPAIVHKARPLLPLVHPEHFDKKEQVLLSYKKVLRTPFHTGWYFIKAFFRLFKRKN